MCPKITNYLQIKIIYTALWPIRDLETHYTSFLAYLSLFGALSIYLEIIIYFSKPIILH